MNIESLEALCPELERFAKDFDHCVKNDRLSRKLEQLARYDVLVIDELGYVPFDREGSDLLFGLIARVYERRSLIVTTNLAFSKWADVFRDAQAAAAVVDRIVHRAAMLKTGGESYRLTEARRRSTGKRRRKARKKAAAK